MKKAIVLSIALTGIVLNSYGSDVAHTYNIPGLTTQENALLDQELQKFNHSFPRISLTKKEVKELWRQTSLKLAEEIKTDKPNNPVLKLK